MKVTLKASILKLGYTIEYGAEMESLYTASVEVSGSETSVDTVSEGLELVMPQSSPVSIWHRDTGTSEFVSGRTLGPVAGVLASSRRSVRQDSHVNIVLEDRVRRIEQQLASYESNMVDLQTQLEEERQAHRAEKETLKEQISKLGTKVDMLMQKSEDQITKLTTLMQDVHSKLESHVLERGDRDDQSVGVGGDRLQDVHPAPSPPNHERPPINDQGPTLYSLQVVNPIVDDRLSEQPSLVLLKRINPISEEEDYDRPPNLLNLGYNSLGDMALGDQPSYSFLQQMNPIAEDETESDELGYTYLNFINPISD